MGGRLTAASDLYSAGVTLWAVLVGRLPIPFDPVIGIAGHTAAVVGAVKDIRDAAPGVSLTLAKVFRKACNVDPGDRYATVAEFDDALSGVREVAANVLAIPAHSGHRACWKVRRRSDGHAHYVCVEVSGTGTLDVVTHHASSGNRVSQLCRPARNEKAVLVGLRYAFDKLTSPSGVSSATND